MLYIYIDALVVMSDIDAFLDFKLRLYIRQGLNNKQILKYIDKVSDSKIEEIKVDLLSLRILK